MTRGYDISAFAGGVIQVRFYFDTIDGVSNHHAGWHVDDVSVLVESQELIIRPQYPRAGDGFGTSVALSGDLLCAGAPSYDGDNNEHLNDGAGFTSYLAPGSDDGRFAAGALRH